jgi:hypothetical protein
MKLSAVLPLLVIASASAFAPPTQRVSFVRPALRMSEETETEAPPAPAPAPAPAAVAPKSSGGKLVPIKEETVEFTAGILGGLAGLALGGPVLGAIGAAAANYVAKTDGDVAEVVSAVSKTSIEVFNYLTKLDEKYEILNKAKASLEQAADKLKSTGNVDPAALEKVENALATTTSKIGEINEEYDLVGAGVTALGVIGDLVEKTVAKAGELNEEYDLTSKAKEALAKGVDKAKEVADKAKA